MVDAVTNLLADLSQSEPNDFTVETHPVNAHHHDVVVAHLPANRTPSASGASTDSERTPVRVDSQESQVSDTETVTDGHRWPRQNSVSGVEIDGANLKNLMFIVVAIEITKCENTNKKNNKLFL